MTAISSTGVGGSVDRRGYGGIIALIAIPQLMFSIDFNSANVALASIGSAMGVEGALLSWLITGFSLAYAGTLVLGGRIADIYGRQRSCMIGASLFLVGDTVAAAAPNMPTLIVGRVIGGLGSAMLIPASFSLVNVLLPEGPVRHHAFAIFSASQGLAMLIGMCGGGFVITTFGWRFSFLLTLPLAIAVLFLAKRFIPAKPAGSEREPIDLAGAALISIGAALALLCITMMGAYGWYSLQGWGTAALAALAIFLFAKVEHVVRWPLVPPEIFRIPDLMGANWAGMCMLGGLGGLFVLFQFFMQRQLGFSAMEAGFGLLPYALATLIMGRMLDRVMGRFPLRPTILTGFAIFLAGMLLFVGATILQSYAAFVPAMILIGIGGTTGVIPLMALSTRGAATDLQGVVTGVLITYQQLGLAFGISIALALIGTQLAAGADLATALHVAQAAMVGFTLLALPPLLKRTREPLPA